MYFEFFFAILITYNNWNDYLQKFMYNVRRMREYAVCEDGRHMRAYAVCCSVMLCYGRWLACRVSMFRLLNRM